MAVKCFVFLNVFLLVCAEKDSVVYRAPSVLSLSGTWVASNSNSSIILKSQVPGCIHTDLLASQLIEDPYFGSNDIAYRWIGMENWTFARKFNDDCHLLQKERVLLLLHGLDTVGDVYLNGKWVGSSNNMFVRYMFDVKTLLQASENGLRVRLQSAVEYARLRHELWVGSRGYVVPPTCPLPVQSGECHVNFVRKMQSSFSWDWGPSFPTQGIWKPIEIIGFDTLIFTDIVVVSNISDGSVKSVSVTVFMDCAASSVAGAFEVHLNGTRLAFEKTRLLPDRNLSANKTFTLLIPQGMELKLWWPNGMGDQPLYPLSVTFVNEKEKTSKSINIGFRTIELVQEPIEGSTGLSFYFRVNGRAFFAKGSNWIPPDAFPSRPSHAQKRRLLESAVQAHMNVLRVWGGGTYEDDAFYAAADQLGLLLWHDLMFACALYPVDQPFLASVAQEVTQQVRRLQHHPSILLWAGNNENEEGIASTWWPAVAQDPDRYKADYVQLYVQTIRPIVEREDPGRPYLTSSPSNGPDTERQGWLAQDPQDTHFGDVHFYTYTGREWDPSTFPRARFVSEYGFQSYPSFETLRDVSLPSDWTLPLSPFMKHRQHHMFGDLEMGRMISEHFLPPSPECGLKGFKDLLHLSQLVQAMAVKTESEKYRRLQSRLVAGEGRTMGALYWQLNDIWQAPSWASIEYGGRWKVLHYYAQNFFAPLLVSPHEEEEEVRVDLVYDPPDVTAVHVSISVYSWDSLKPRNCTNFTVAMSPGSSQTVWRMRVTELLSWGGCPDRDHCFVVATASDGGLSSDNFLLLGEPKAARGLADPNITVSVSLPFATSSSPYSYEVRVVGENVAPFVWLESGGGRFSDNGFLLVGGARTLLFYSDSPTAPHITATSLYDTTRC